MNVESTLAAVREMAENAYRRPAPLRLRLAKAEEARPGPRRAIIPYEELHPVRIGGRTKTLKRRPKTQHVTLKAMEKDFMAAALEKTAA